MDRAGHDNDSRTLRVDDAPSAVYDEKKSAPASLSSGETIENAGRGVAATGHEDAQEKGQQLTQDDDEIEDGREQPLEPVKSKQPSVNNTSSIPNGGLMAWLQVMGAFFLFFNSWYASDFLFPARAPLCFCPRIPLYAPIRYTGLWVVHMKKCANADHQTGASSTPLDPTRPTMRPTSSHPRAPRQSPGSAASRPSSCSSSAPSLVPSTTRVTSAPSFWAAPSCWSWAR